MRRIRVGLTVITILIGTAGIQAALAGQVKDFTLTAKEVPWTLASGVVIKAWAYNGQVPGPEIRVKEGDRVRVTFKNELPVASSIHWHGLRVPWTMDGPPGINQRPVEPGGTFVYEFVAGPTGTHFYHSHGSGAHDEALQMDMGLYGAFIVEGKARPKYDVEHTLILSERLSTLMPWAESGTHSHGAAGHGAPAQVMGHAMDMPDTFFVNGKSWPAVVPLRVKRGQRVRLRLINAGSSSTHPMHLHGHSFRVVAADGHSMAAPIVRDVIVVSPGERYDIEFVADNPGVWLLHCHELHHMDAGMALLVQYDGYEPVVALPAPRRTAKVYVVNEESQDVWVLNARTHAVLAKIKVGQLPHGIVASPDGKALYVTNMGSNDVTVINSQTDAATVMSGAGLNPHESAVSPDGRWLYVSNPSGNTVTVHDMMTHHPAATISVGRFPHGIALSPDGGRLYVANRDGGDVSVIETVSQQVVRTIPAAPDAHELALSRDGKTLYVVSTDINRVTFIDTLQEREIRSVTVGAEPNGIALDSNGTALWVVNSGSQNVQALDSQTGTLLLTIPVTGGPRSLSLSPDGKELWTADTGANTVSVVDLAKRQVTATIPVGQGPNRILILSP
jgi:YVTN family beta-propeller protein